MAKEPSAIRQQLDVLLDMNASGRRVEVTPRLRELLVTSRHTARSGDASDLDFAAADILREALLKDLELRALTAGAGEPVSDALAGTFNGRSFTAFALIFINNTREEMAERLRAVSGGALTGATVDSAGEGTYASDMPSCTA